MLICQLVFPRRNLKHWRIVEVINFSMEELDATLLEKQRFLPLSRQAAEQLSSTIVSRKLDSLEADNDQADLGFNPSTCDLREKVLREIRVRRGQKNFVMD